MNDRKSTNYSILKQLMSKSRRITISPKIDYIIIYTFLYKYCSDRVKDFLDFELKDKNINIAEAYRDKSLEVELSFDSLTLNGFYIKNSNAFIEEFINYNDMKPGFLPDFLKVFPEYTIFNLEYHNLEYFNQLFKIIDDEIDTHEFDSNVTENILEIIRLISNLDVFDEKFKFGDVFSVMFSSRNMHVDSNPEYITQILSEIVLADKKTISSAYDPFIKDASSIMKLYDKMEFNIKYFYGKDKNEVNYIYSLARFFINNISFNEVYLKKEDALDSIDIDGASFDVILSRIPISIKNYYSSNLKQNMEIAKRSKRSEIENLLLNNLNMDDDSFKQDTELNQALENLVEKINYSNDSNNDFTGEYESLKDSEFLFLINLVDSLKDDGIMAVSISENFLFKKSLETLRKYLTVNKNYIDTIIRIPNEIDRSRPEVVIVFKKNKKNDDVLFIDMSSDYETERSSLIFSGLFRRNLVLTDDTISKMKNVFLNRLTLPKFSNSISIDEISENNFNLSVSRYVDTFEGEFISLDDLRSEKENIESAINDLNSEIEKMMDELNIRY